MASSLPSSSSSSSQDAADLPLCQESVLALKRQAVASKKAGNVEQAKALLRQAKQMEAQLLSLAAGAAPANANAPENAENAGTAGSANADAAAAVAAAVTENDENTAASDAGKATTTTATTTSEPASSQDPPQQQQQQQQQAKNETAAVTKATPKQEGKEEAKQPAAAAEKKANDSTAAAAATSTEEALSYVPDPVNQAMDEANLDELQQGNHAPFTDDELLDTEGLHSLRQVMGADALPSMEFYNERILRHKRQALQYKQAANIDQAKWHLQKSKQLTQARDVLYAPKQEQEEEEEELVLDANDLSLLQELNMYDDHGRSISEGEIIVDEADKDNVVDELEGETGSGRSGGAAKSSNILDVEDLDDLPDNDQEAAVLLHDLVEAGLQLPNIADLEAHAAECKQAAVTAKKHGDLTAAKQALQDFKKWQAAATKLQRLVQIMERKKKNGGANIEDEDKELPEDPEAALEAMYQKASEKQQQPAAAVSKSTTPTPNKPQLKSSADYKAEAVKHKQAGNKEQALAALKLYKQAMAAESQAAAQAQFDKVVQTLEAESQFATTQAMRFLYYQRFGDGENANALGRTMEAAWRRYAADCATYAQRLLEQQQQQQQQQEEATAQEDGSASMAQSSPSPPPPLLTRSTRADLQCIRHVNDNKNNTHGKDNEQDVVSQADYETEVLDFVGRTCDATHDERIEVALVSLDQLQNNKHLRETLLQQHDGTSSDKASKAAASNADDKLTMLPAPATIKCVVTIHLPANAENPDEDVKLEFVPSSSSLGGQDSSIYVFESSQYVSAERSSLGGQDSSIYVFESSQYVSAEHGSSRGAKLFARRLTRRRCLTINVIYQRTVKSKKGGLFGKSSTMTQDVSLGSASMELKDLLETNYIVATDLRLVENRKEVGGRLRLAIRTRRPFGEDADIFDNEALNTNSTMQGYPHLLLPQTELK